MTLDYASDDKHWTIDARRWPVVIMTGHGATMSDEVVAAAIAKAAEVLRAHGGPFALVHNDRKATGMSPRQRRMMADAQLDPVYQRCRANAFVLDSLLLQGVMTAIFWMQTHHTPHRVFTQLDAAVHWSLHMCGVHEAQRLQG